MLEVVHLQNLKLIACCSFNKENNAIISAEVRLTFVMING